MILIQISGKYFHLSQYLIKPMYFSIILDLTTDYLIKILLIFKIY